MCPRDESPCYGHVGVQLAVNLRVIYPLPTHLHRLLSLRSQRAFTLPTSSPQPRAEEAQTPESATGGRAPAEARGILDEALHGFRPGRGTHSAAMVVMAMYERAEKNHQVNP